MSVFLGVVRPAPNLPVRFGLFAHLSCVFVLDCSPSPPTWSEGGKGGGAGIGARGKQTENRRGTADNTGNRGKPWVQTNIILFCFAAKGGKGRRGRGEPELGDGGGGVGEWVAG